MYSFYLAHAPLSYGAMEDQDRVCKMTTTHQDTGNICGMKPYISDNANDTIERLHQENTEAAAKPQSHTEIYYISKITDKTLEHHEYDTSDTRLQAIVSTYLRASIDREKCTSYRSGY